MPLSDCHHIQEPRSAGVEIGRHRDARHEQQGAEDEEDAAQPFPIGHPLLRRCLAKFLCGQSVGAVTGIVANRKHDHSLLLTASSEQERPNGSLCGTRPQLRWIDRALWDTVFAISTKYDLRSLAVNLARRRYNSATPQ